MHMIRLSHGHAIRSHDDSCTRSLFVSPHPVDSSPHRAPSHHSPHDFPLAAHSPSPHTNTNASAQDPRPQLSSNPLLPPLTHNNFRTRHPSHPSSALPALNKPFTQ